MKTWRSMNDWAFIGDEGVLVVWIQDIGRMIRMMEDIPEKVSNRGVNTLAGITPEQPSSPPQQARHLPCGCILCICEDEVRCHGCGAKMCKQHSSPPQDARVRSAEATKPAAGGDSYRAIEVSLVGSLGTDTIFVPDNTPTPLVDGIYLSIHELPSETFDRMRHLAESLERVARMMAEALKLNLDPSIALAAWRELEERK